MVLDLRYGKLYSYKFKEIEELHSNIESITEELIQMDSKQIAS